MFDASFKPGANNQDTFATASGDGSIKVCLLACLIVCVLPFLCAFLFVFLLVCLCASLYDNNEVCGASCFFCLFQTTVVELGRV